LTSCKVDEFITSLQQQNVCYLDSFRLPVASKGRLFDLDSGLNSGLENP
jgi:hypothetical protein